MPRRSYTELVKFRRHIVYMRDIVGYSYRQIGEVLGCHRSTAFLHYKEAKKRKMKPLTCDKIPAWDRYLDKNTEPINRGKLKYERYLESEKDFIKRKLKENGRKPKK